MYAHKSNIITSIFRVDEEGLLDTIRGQVYHVEKDDYIATNALGEQLVFSEEYVKAMEGIRVEPKKEVKVTKIKGLDAEQFKQQYIAQTKENCTGYKKGDTWNFTNDEDYVFEVKNDGDKSCC